MKTIIHILMPMSLLLLATLTLQAQSNAFSKGTEKRIHSKSYDPDRKAVPIKPEWSNTEFGLSMGTATYIGDLQSESIDFSQSNAFVGMMLRTPLHRFLTARAFIGIGQVHADDAKSDDLDIRKRNLHFKSSIWEIGLAGEFVLPLTKPGKKGFLANLSPYAVAGISMFHFNPKAKYQGEWIELKPLYTEGQRINNANARSYSLLQPALPFGGGLKYRVSNKVSLAVECAPRKTFTDYLDDVSTVYPDMDKLKAAEGERSVKMSFRGDEVPGREFKKVTVGAQRGASNSSDWFMTTTFSVRVKIGKEKK